MSDCGFNIALLRNVVKLVESRDAIIYVSIFFSYLLTTFIDCYVNLFFFLYPFQVSPSKENACRLLTKENIILNAIKMLEMNLKIIGNDIKVEINEGWGNIRLRMTLKINVG